MPETASIDGPLDFNALAPSHNSAHCTGYQEDGPEVVYRFDVATADRYRFTLSHANGSTYDQAIYLLAACPSSIGVPSCVDGIDASGSSGDEVLTTYLDVGSYLVVSDSTSSSNHGDFTLLAEEVGPGPQGDTCGDPIPLSAHAAGDRVTVPLDFTTAQDDDLGSCQFNTGPDLVYSLTLTDVVSVAALVNLTGVPGTVSLYARTDCSAATDLFCTTDRVDLDQLGVSGATTTYYLYVDADSRDLTGGTLTVSLSAPRLSPPGDVCAAPLTLSGLGTVHGTLVGMANDYNPNCGSISGLGPDQITAWTPTASGTYVITVTPSSNLDPAIYLLDSCPAQGDGVCTQGADESFDLGGAETMRVNATAGQTYFIGVDSYDASATGTYDLTVAVPPPPPDNDTCADPTALNLDAPLTNQSTVYATNDYTDADFTSCLSDNGKPGRDVVYRFTPSASDVYDFSVTPAAGTYAPAISLLAGTCPSPGALSTCINNATTLDNAPVSLRANLTAGTTYYLVVDSDYPDQGGNFTVGVALAPQGPSNDLCATPKVLSLGLAAALSGDTSTARNDYALTPATSCTGFATDGPDVVYRFAAPSAGTYRFILEPDNFLAAFYLLDSCPACTGGGCINTLSSCLLGSNGSNTQVLDHAMAANDSVLLVVDGFSTSSFGTFSLSAQLLNPPANDTCAGVETLTENTTLSGDTSQASNDTTTGSTSCGYGNSGQDVVYRFTPNATATYYFTVNAPTSSLKPSIYLVSGPCPSGTVSTCLATSAPGAASASLSAALTAGTTYFLIVDATGTSPTSGAFTVAVSQQPGVSNDVCSTNNLPVLTEGSTGVSGSTLGALNNYTLVPGSPGCTQYHSDGPDVVYSFTPSQTKSYAFELAPSSNYDASFYLLSGCPTQTGTVTSINLCSAGADVGGGGASETFSVSLTAGVPVFVFVDGFSSNSSGSFTLTAQ